MLRRWQINITCKSSSREARHVFIVRAIHCKVYRNAKASLVSSLILQDLLFPLHAIIVSIHSNKQPAFDELQNDIHRLDLSPLSRRSSSLRLLGASLGSRSSRSLLRAGGGLLLKVGERLRLAGGGLLLCVGDLPLLLDRGGEALLVRLSLSSSGDRRLLGGGLRLPADSSLEYDFLRRRGGVLDFRLRRVEERRRESSESESESDDELVRSDEEEEREEEESESESDDPPPLAALASASACCCARSRAGADCFSKSKAGVSMYTWRIER